MILLLWMFTSGTQIHLCMKQKIKNIINRPKVFNDNPDIGTAGLYELYTRISFVCCLREN